MPTIKILLVNRTVIEFTAAELSDFLRTGTVFAMFLGAVSFLLLANPEIFTSTANSYSRGFYWALSIFLYTILMPRYLDWMFHWWWKATRRPLFHLGPTIPLIIGLTYLMEVLYFASGEMLPGRSGPITGYVLAANIVIGFSLESIGLYWLLPQYLSKKSEFAADKKIVQVSGEEIPISIIRLVKSDARYLIITTEYGETRYLCRLKDFLAQVSEQDGISPHRSYWIAKDNVIGINGARIRTKTGHNVPVARGKISEARVWLRQHGLPH